MLNIENINLFYGASQALRDVSLSAQIGQVTAILGRNGVGKTSLLRVLIGHQRTASCKIIWQGQDITTLAPHERARLGLGYVPQGREVFPLLNVRENLETGFAPLKRGQRMIEEDIFSLFPVLSEMMHRRAGDLSGGQQQQLAIARALVTKPRLLILDEPTEGIQPSIIKDIGRAIDYLRQRGDMAIVLVEQYFEFARDLCDSYAVMDRGRVVLAGKKSDMVETDVRAHLSV